MEKELKLINLYCTICRYYNIRLAAIAQRLSNNFCPKFSDEECITIYLWGIYNQKFTVGAVYEFTKDYYGDWFPTLPCYKSFNKRICYLSEALQRLADILLSGLEINPEVKAHLIDSMPIVVANAKRSSSAKSASEVCNKGYCDSKKMYYYGVKIHALGQSQYQTLPIPKVMYLTPASVNDLPAGKYMLDGVSNIDVFGDKMYKDKDWEAKIRAENNITVFTPVKLQKGQKRLESADNMFSAAVSRVRQPIESFFNWLQEKTNIQEASKIRSTSGLIAFIFVRISLACLIIGNII
jgi:hypothetical protein